MLSFPRCIWRCIFGPSLSRCHASVDDPNKGYNYVSNGIEDTTDKLLKLVSISKVIITYTLPVWGVFLYRRGCFSEECLLGFAKYAGWICLFYIGIFVVRGLGRTQNSEYVRFINIYENSLNNPTDQEKKKQLKSFDYAFTHWPVDFRWNEVELNRTKRKSSTFWERISTKHNNPITAILFGIPTEILAYTIAHTVGISIMYPGSTSLLGAALGPVMLGGRSKLVEEYLGDRAKLQAEDGNFIDTMFVDRRRRAHPNRYDRKKDPDVVSPNGDTLVICCEGNVGFYEGGAMVTPLECGYSVLGWNHPGFMWSTGAPYPDAESNAIDVVMQYAINKLNFQPSNIIIFAWSIGTFTCTKAAASYPDIKGVVIDAGFNDVMVFAHKIMPQFAEPLISYTVRNHLNLHNAKNLRSYPGPVTFIRRTNDEVMNIDGPTDTRSNLGNLLLEDFLVHRFPRLFESSSGKASPQSIALKQWLHASNEEARNDILSSHEVSTLKCTNMLLAGLTDGEPLHPMTVGEELTSEEKSKLALFLASKYMHHYSSTHCTPLPGWLFPLPWDITALKPVEEGEDGDFEFVQARLHPSVAAKSPFEGTSD